MTTAASHRKEQGVQKGSSEIVTKMHIQLRRLKTTFWALNVRLNSFVSSNDVTIFKHPMGTDSEHYKYHPSARFHV